MMDGLIVTTHEPADATRARLARNHIVETLQRLETMTTIVKTR
jgi:hypothetical protein